MRLPRALFLAAAAVTSLVIGAVLWATKKPVAIPGGEKPLRIAAYSSFTSSWGPGPKIVESFEKKCGCRVILEDFGDSGLMIQKLRMQSGRDAPDVVLGFDQFAAEEAERLLSWRELPDSLPARSAAPQADSAFKSARFLPFDWAPIAFVFRKGEIEPPRSLKDLLSPRFKSAIALEDPRTSAPGLQFLVWVLSVYREEEGVAYLKSLMPNIHSVSPSWSTAYGLFKKKEAKLVLSYQTSPIYHVVAEKDESFVAAAFTEGHVNHVEYAAIPAGCESCERAGEFLRFLLESESQTRLMELNYMLPVSIPPTGEFAKLESLRDLSSSVPRRERLIELWKEVYRE